jgi:uncharacterized damage-inducible protein DinB
MHKNQRVADMAVDVLARQAGILAKQTGEPFEEALKTVLETEAGRQLRELRNGPHHDERAQEWQESLTRQRAEERAEALGWSSSSEVPGSPADIPRRGPR